MLGKLRWKNMLPFFPPFRRKKTTFLANNNYSENAMWPSLEVGRRQSLSFKGGHNKWSSISLWLLTIERLLPQGEPQCNSLLFHCGFLWKKDFDLKESHSLLFHCGFHERKSLIQGKLQWNELLFHCGFSWKKAYDLMGSHNKMISYFIVALLEGRTLTNFSFVNIKSNSLYPTTA